MNSMRAGTSWGLTRHIALEIFKTFLFSLLVLELCYSLLVSILAAGRYDLDLPLVLPVLWYAATAMLSDSIPLALMFASSLVYGRFVADREVMAARSFGISNRKILLPALILGIVFSFSGYFINGFVVPLMKHKRNDVGSLLIDQFRYLGKGANRDFRFGNLNLWIMEHDGRRLTGVFVGPRADSDTDEILSREKIEKLNLVSYPYCLYAGEGTILFPEELPFRSASALSPAAAGEAAEPVDEALAGHIIIELRDVSVFYSSELHSGGNKSFFQRMHLDQLDISFDPARKAKRAKRGKELNNRELSAEIAALRDADGGEPPEGREAKALQRLQFEYQGRIGRMFSSGLFVLMGGLIALLLNSGNRLLPFFVSCALVPAVFYGGTVVFQLAVHKGLLPLPLVQLPAVLLLCMLAGGLWRLERKVTR
jgi:lipopolysaccharide export LptBFGC system permease protein LptF